MKNMYQYYFYSGDLEQTVKAKDFASACEKVFGKKNLPEMARLTRFKERKLFAYAKDQPKNHNKYKYIDTFECMKKSGKYKVIRRKDGVEATYTG